MAQAPKNKTTPTPEREEERWVGEGGSNQHYRHTDEPKRSDEAPGHASRPGHPGGAADNDGDGSAAAEKDRSWRPFDATYGKDFGERLNPGKTPGNTPGDKKEPR